MTICPACVEVLERWEVRVVMLAGIFAAVIGPSAIFVSFAELKMNASLEISKTMLRFTDLHGELRLTWPRCAVSVSIRDG
jgi:hypothetical protein